MLVRSVKAVNFMRFSLLDLRDLPGEGIIGIEGPNESGKTTIGEAILFAFFGKTRLSAQFGVDRLIRWDSDHLVVEVEFGVEGRGEYLIHREIDRSGTNYVKIIELPERQEIAAGNVQVSELIARQLRYDFSEALETFYLHQFDYVVGRNARGSFLEKMTGTAQIDEAIAALGKEIEQLEREYAQYQKEVHRNNQQIGKYDRNISRIEDLRQKTRDLDDRITKRDDRRGELEREIEFLKNFAANLERDSTRFEQAARQSIFKLENSLRDVMEKYQVLDNAEKSSEFGFFESHEDVSRRQKKQLEQLLAFSKEFAGLRRRFEDLQHRYGEKLDDSSERSLFGEKGKLEGELQKHRGACFFYSVLAAITLVGASVFGALCVLLELRLPGDQSLADALASIGITAERGSAVFLLLCGVSLVLFLVCLARRISLGGRSTRFREEISMMDTRIDEATADHKKLQDLLAVSGEGEVARVVELAGSFTDDTRRELLGPITEQFEPFLESSGEGAPRTVLKHLQQGEQRLRVLAVERVKKQQGSLRDVQRELKKSRSERDRVRNEIREYEAQISKRQSYVEKNVALEERAAAVNADIDCRRSATQLLEETRGSILAGIGPNLSKFVRSALPWLTGDRYRDVKVSNDLAVKVFTSEKCDFVEVGELSGGTLEGLELAVRLASSQAFLLHRSRQAQFVFLDEPFKMMDADRAAETLSALGRLCPEIRQFFVLQPNFTPEQRANFDRIIRTKYDTTELLTEKCEVEESRATEKAKLSAELATDD